MIRPSDYGFSPSKFPAYRTSQTQALRKAAVALEADRIVGVQAGTGMGKGLLGATLALESGGRSGVLVSSRALADQMQADAAGLFTDIRGRRNYECPSYSDCDQGRHYRCPLQKATKAGSEEIPPECPYVLTLEQARESNVLTNYNYFLEIARRGTGLGSFDRLICDEAHQILDVLTSAAAVQIRPADCSNLGISRPPSEIEDWAKLAAAKLPAVEARLQEAREFHDVRAARRAEELAFKLSTVAACTEEDWALDGSGRDWVFEPVDASLFGHWILDGALEVVLMSATLRPILFELLGVDQYKFIEMGSDFAPDDAPIWVMSQVRVDWNMSESDKRVLLSAVDNWIQRRLDRKGVIHAVSYDRAEWLKRESRYGDLMITHPRRQAHVGVRRFREAEAPSILVSPAVDTGFDFPGEAADWQILLKLPRPPVKGSPNLWKRRRERFPRWTEYLTCQKLEQMAGRINREKGERGETAIFDAHAGDYFLRKNRELFTAHFNRRIREARMQPQPLELTR